LHDCLGEQFLTFRGSIRRFVFGLLSCAFLAAATTWAGSDLRKPSPASSKSPSQKTAVQSSSKSAKKKTASTRRRYRKEGARTRLARLKLQPERASEIQQALVQRGYLNAGPSGVWDDSTRDAMKRFQIENGFPPTGLPEAKSLMKLGLGPHPLPDELDPATQARMMSPPSSDRMDTPASK
jgi:peptidoglycan hydrolase-like protein with peptidoglycan-binding domain